MTLVNNERHAFEQGASERIEERLDFETLISDLSSRFIKLRPDEVDREIEDALRRVCEPLDIDLAVLWQWSVSAPDVVAPTHTYSAREDMRPSEPMQQEQYPWSRQQVLAGRMIVVTSLQDIPPEGAVDKETCRLFGIKSVLCLPLSIGDDPPVGALGFNALRSERDWPEALIKRLQLVAQIFTNALARRRHEQSQQESASRLTVATELADLGFYEVDFSQGVAYVDERFRKLCGIPPERATGPGPLEFWLEQLHPDDRDRVLDMRQQLHDGALERLSIEYRFLHPTHGERWLQHVARVVRRDASGQTTYSHGVLRDV
ncbi:MAG: PAS domain-containing protein, partial [Rhodoferax sp.]